jgi:hypothetical protein
MEIKYYPSGTLSSEQIRSGLKFIRRRFFEDWSIKRIDVNFNTIKNRVNILLYDRENLIGWLGIESDGEIVNCCIDEKYDGVYHLQELIKEAYKSFPQKHFYAHVPIEQLGSACAFIKTGMKLDELPKIDIKEYQGKSIKLVKLNYEVTRKEFNVEDEYLEEMLNRIKAIETRNTSPSDNTMKIFNYKSFILCLIMSFTLYFLLIKNVAKISWQDYFSFVANNESYIEDQKIFAQYFDFLSIKIENYERLSYEQQINLIKELLNDLDVKINSSTLSQILNITNRNQDIIRVVRNIRKFHKELINNDIYKKKTLNILNALCEAYRLVLSDTGGELVPHIKMNLRTAEEQFKIVLKAAEKLPNKLRDDIKLESLRYLTYCSLRLEEKDSRINDWIKTAERLKEDRIQSYSEEASFRYYQNYFWIFLVNCINTIKENNSKQDQELEKTIEHYYGGLSKDDPDHEYLKAKLLQHLQFFPLETRDKIYEYISFKTQ